MLSRYLEFVQKVTNDCILVTPLRIVTYDHRIIGDYRLATKVSTQTLTNEQNRVNKYQLLSILLKHVRMKRSAT